MAWRVTGGPSGVTRLLTAVTWESTIRNSWIPRDSWTWRCELSCSTTATYDLSFRVPGAVEYRAAIGCVAIYREFAFASATIVQHIHRLSRHSRILYRFVDRLAEANSKVWDAEANCKCRPRRFSGRQVCQCMNTDNHMEWVTVKHILTSTYDLPSVCRLYDSWSHVCILNYKHALGHAHIC